LYSFLLPDKFYLIDYIGGKIYLNFKEGVMTREVLLGLYENQKINLFKRILKPNMTIIDVGAHRGYFSFISAKLIHDKGKIYAIEPDPENYSWLKKGLSVNNYKIIEPIQLAFSNKSGFLKLFKGDKSGHHSLTEDMGYGSTSIKVQRLDDFINENNIEKVDLIKIDVEGADIEVIEGAEKILNQENLKIIMDIHHIDREKLFNIFIKNNYSIYKYNLYRTLKIDKYEFINGEINEIFIEKN
jgi:FkbM family methyltransferase